MLTQIVHTRQNSALPAMVTESCSIHPTWGIDQRNMEVVRVSDWNSKLAVVELMFGRPLVKRASRSIRLVRVDLDQSQKPRRPGGVWFLRSFSYLHRTLGQSPRFGLWFYLKTRRVQAEIGNAAPVQCIWVMSSYSNVHKSKSSIDHPYQWQMQVFWRWLDLNDTLANPLPQLHSPN